MDICVGPGKVCALPLGVAGKTSSFFFLSTGVVLGLRNFACIPNQNVYSSGFADGGTIDQVHSRADKGSKDHHLHEWKV